MLSTTMHPFIVLILTVIASNSGNVATVNAFLTNVSPTAVSTRTRGGRLGFPQSLSGLSSSLSAESNPGEESSVEEEDWRQQLPHPLNTYREQCLQRVECSLPTGDLLHVYVIGTAHIANDSSRDVRLLLETMHPDIIFLELCYSRFMELEQEKSPKPQGPLPKREGLRTRLCKGRNNKVASSFNRLERFSFNHLGESVEKEAESMGSKYGGEFDAAYEYWKEVVRKHAEEETIESSQTTTSPPRLVLGDRPIQVTVARILENMSRWDKVKGVLGVLAVGNPIILSLGGSAALTLMVAVIVGTGWCGTAMSIIVAYLLVKGDFEDTPSTEEITKSTLNKASDNDKITAAELLEDLPTEEFLKSVIYKASDDGDNDEIAVDEFFNDFPPWGKDVLLRERDIYMACKLYQSCGYLLPLQEYTDEDDGERKLFSVVAVVGAAHVDGMCAFFSKLLVEQNPEDHLPDLLKSKKLGEEAFKELIEGVSVINS